MIDWGFTCLISLYCLSILYLWLGWERIPIIANEDTKPSVSVIVPIRNEVENILGLLVSLQNQLYSGPLEIIIINDYSEDDSYEVVREFIADKASFKLYSLETYTGKKAAISEGIKLATGDIILTTDGDCVARPTWVEAMVNAFDESTQMVSGPVKFATGNSILSKMQSIEFASLIGSGAALIGWQKPLMANGANMGFRKSAFEAVGGFEGNTETASGDDVFLLHKIASYFPNSIAFAKQEDAIMQTVAQPTLKSFVNQRIRWASKWKGYNDVFTKLTAVLIFMLSLSLIAFPFMVKFNSNSMFLWINLWVVKSFFDFFFIRQVSNFLGQKIKILPFVILQIVYPFYVVFTALFSFQKSYVWKGRRVS